MQVKQGMYIARSLFPKLKDINTNSQMPLSHKKMCLPSYFLFLWVRELSKKCNKIAESKDLTLLKAP